MKQKAFSLIELSIVILIIGILIAGVTQASRLVGRMRLASARTQTQSSPVAGIRDLHSWFEATSDNSFDSAEAEDGLSITNWYDINPQVTSKITANQATTTNKPTYIANGINNLPAISFDGANSILRTTTNPPMILGYGSGTVFVVFNPTNVAVQEFLVMQPKTNCVNNIEIGFNVAGGSFGNYGIHAGCSIATAAPNGTIVINQPVIMTLVMLPSPITSGSTANTVIYKNGGTALALTAITNGYNGALGGSYATGTAQMMIGARDNSGSVDAYFAGKIAEIIIFSRNLKDEERKAVEAYLGRKWGIKVS